MKKTALHLTAALLVLLPPVAPVLAQAPATPTSAQPSPANLQAQAAAKYNAYVKAFNDLNGMFYGGTQGMPALLEKYRSQRLDEKTDTREPTMYMNTSMLANHAEALRRGVQMPHAGPYAELDALARAMHANSSELNRASREFDDYVRSKKYLEDGFARGRELNRVIVPGWERLIQQYAQFGAALEQAERLDRLQAIAEARAEGDRLHAATLEAMLHASDLINHFDELAEFRDAAKVQAGDAIAQALEAAVTDMRAQADQAAQGRDVYRHGLIAQYMTRVLGSYRGLKSGFSPKARDHEDMVDAYNRAVRQVNRLQ